VKSEKSKKEHMLNKKTTRFEEKTTTLITLIMRK
jgi:hypothetical protein